MQHCQSGCTPSFSSLCLQSSTERAGLIFWYELGLPVLRCNLFPAVTQLERNLKNAILTVKGIHATILPSCFSSHLAMISAQTTDYSGNRRKDVQHEQLLLFNMSTWGSKLILFWHWLTRTICMTSYVREMLLPEWPPKCHSLKLCLCSHILFGIWCALLMCILCIAHNSLI